MKTTGSLLLMFSLALSTTGWIAEGETPSDHGALSSAVELYNRNSGLDSAFRLLQVKSPLDGVVKECSGISSTQPGSPILQIKCDPVTQENRRVKRSGKVRKFLRKLKKLLPGSGSVIGSIRPIRIRTA